MIRALPRLVARIPATVHTKLLVAFLTIAGLLIALGAVGLEVLGEVNRRSEDLVKLQRKIAAYRQLQHDTTAQLYSVASALLMPAAYSLFASRACFSSSNTKTSDEISALFFAKSLDRARPVWVNSE